MTARQEKANKKKELAEEIREACRVGTLPAGALLPTVRELALRHGLSKRVVNEELQKLVDEGWLRSVPRVGTFVKEAPAAEDHFLQHSVVLLASNNGQPPAGQQRAGWLSYISVGAIREIEERGLHVLILNPGRLCGEVIERLVKERPLGVVIPETVNLKSVREYASKLQKSGVPVVINSGDPRLAEFDRVSSDAEQGGYLLTQWLLNRGRKHVRMVWPVGLEEYWAYDRQRGYEAAMKEAGLNPLPLLEIPDVPAQAPLNGDDVREVAALLRPLFETAVPLDGILAASDGPAAIVDAACRELGLQPGPNLDITGYDNYWQDLAACGFVGAKPAATIERNNELIGSEMVQLVLHRADEISKGRPVIKPIFQKVNTHLLDTSQVASP